MSVLWLPGNRPAIPEISDERLAELSRIKPLKRVDGKLVIGDTKRPKDYSYLWSEETTPLPEGWELYDIGRFESYHGCGYIALFKPSIAEVLAQLDTGKFRGSVPQVDYFEIQEESAACYAEGDGHRAVVILYSKTDPFPQHKPEVP